jgi:hypothetical protein
VIKKTVERLLAQNISAAKISKRRIDLTSVSPRVAHIVRSEKTAAMAAFSHHASFDRARRQKASAIFANDRSPQTARTAFNQKDVPPQPGYEPNF